MTKPTIEEVVNAIRSQLTEILNKHPLINRNHLLILDNFVLLEAPKEPEQGSISKTIKEQVDTIQMLSDDLTLAKEGLKLVKSEFLYSRNCFSGEKFESICKQLGVE